MVPALAHRAMGHGLLKPIVRPSCARAKGEGQGALRLFEMAKGVVARITSRIDVCTGLKIVAALGQDTASRRKTFRNAASGTIELERWGADCTSQPPARARERRGTCRAAGSVCGFVECVCILRTDVCVRTARTEAALGHVTGSLGEAFSNASVRAIEREKGDMARDSRRRISW